MDWESVHTHIDANELLANDYYLEGHWVVVGYQQFAENEMEDCHGVESWIGARGRHEVKDQLRWLLHCLLPSLGYGAVPPVATPFAVGVTLAMAYAASLHCYA